MSNNTNLINTNEKTQLRLRIEAQVNDYLARGGRIEVLGDDHREGARIGSVWHGHDDIEKFTRERQ